MMLVLVLLCTGISFSQSKKEKKADKDFEVFEYIDAREVYLELANDEKYEQSAHIYRNIAETYYWNSEYNEAVEWYQKLLDKDEDFRDEATKIDYFRASQALRSKGDLAGAGVFYQEYLAKGGKARPETKTAEYVVKLVELDVINTTFSDFGPTYYGDKLVYASAAKEGEGVRLHEWNKQPFLDLYVTDLDEEGMPEPGSKATFDKTLNTIFHESSAVFTNDGQTVYFTRNNFTDGKKGKDKDKTIRLKLYKSTKQGANWTQAIDLEELNNDEWSVAHPTLSIDEDQKYLYFSSDRPGEGDEDKKKAGKNMSDLWMVEILGDNEFSEPKNLGPLVNTGNRESFPFISQKNKLYFSSDGWGGQGGYDVYVIDLDEDGMPTGELENLGDKINSPQDDFGFIVKEDDRMGYLTSNRESPLSGSKGDQIYLHRESCDITIVGTATDKFTGEPLSGATVSLLDENNNPVHIVTTGADGKYRFEEYAACNSVYLLRATKPNCDSVEKIINTPNKTETIESNMKLGCCDPCDLKCILTINGILFNFDKFDIRETIEDRKVGNTPPKIHKTENITDLRKLLAALKLNENLAISIESHTDSRGSHKYNEWLSTQRAIATKKWLMENGIAADRLCAQGFGETELITPCPDGVECTENDHTKNRRSEYRIIYTPAGERCDDRSQRKPCINIETDEMSWPQWKRKR